MRTCFTLPDGYKECAYLNPYADRRLRRNLNIASFFIGVAVIAVGWLWRGFDGLLALLRRGLNAYLLWLALLAVCAIACLSLRELLRGLLMRLFAGIRPHCARKGLLLFIGSEAYFCRRDFLVLTLAPVALFAVLFALPTVFLQGAWFWLAIALQLVNLGSAVDDYYMIFRALRQPKRALFHDSGIAVAIYTEKPDETNADSRM